MAAKIVIWRCVPPVMNDHVVNWISETAKNAMPKPSASTALTTRSSFRLNAVADADPTRMYSAIAESSQSSVAFFVGEENHRCIIQIICDRC
jgi:hypothetical protein